MKKILLVAFLAILSTTAVYAEGGHGGGWGRGGGERGGWGRGGGWGGGWIAPVLIGGVIAYDLANPYPYYAQPVPVYVQPYPAPEVATPPGQYWYFCRAANAYYPYVPSCPGGWQAVPMTPPR